MTNPGGRKRSAISTLLAVIFVAASLVVLGVKRVTSLFRQKYVPIEQLKFPVLVFQPGGMRVFAEWDDIALQKFPERSLRTPADGTVIVDSEFNQFTPQENVHRQKEGDPQMVRPVSPAADAHQIYVARLSAAGRNRDARR